ncbi:MAG: haloacid dehalogenase type II [Bryobacteraceae bacterium]
MSVPLVKALTFDVFGTVVDWRGSIAAEGVRLGRARGIDIDWEKFADRWRAGYGPSMDLVRKGQLPWMTIDQLHRRILDRLLDEFNITGLSESDKEQWNHVWRRLRPWRDSVAGLTRLKAHYIIATLSNGNVALLTNMAKNAGLPWDAILSAELAGHYKTDPEVYQTAARLLGLKPEECMMVAAHKNDLRAAAKVGFRTAFVERPLEFGPMRTPDMAVEPDIDLHASDFLDLARLLGA